LLAIVGGIVVADISNIRQLVSAARTRILLICPDCGQEHTEFADKLRGSRFYTCIGDDCGYRFDLVSGPRGTSFQRFVYAWRRLFTALLPAG
jgi:transposase-like protein